LVSVHLYQLFYTIPFTIQRLVYYRFRLMTHTAWLRLDWNL
jgi:hypothetical protein